MGRIRVGIIGVGGISLRHLHGFTESPDSEVTALVDIDPVRIKTAKEKVPEVSDVAAFSDYKAMIKAGIVDAVEISTPHTLHYKMVMDSLDAGLHVMVEKPMVCSAIHARDVIKKAEETDRVVMIAYQRHFQPQYRYIKQIVDSDELGEIMSFSALQSQAWRNAQKGTWRQDPSQSGGGQLNDSGSHLLDILLWTSGLSAKSVHAFIDNRDTQVDINSSLSLSMTNGAQGTVTVIGDSTCRWYEDFTIWGTKGVIFYRNGRIMRCDAQGEICEPVDLPESGNMHQNFCDTILGRDTNWVPAECGLRVIELTEAAWRSAQTCNPCDVASL